MESVYNKINSIQTKEDFLGFLQLLIQDLDSNADEWTNNDLKSYLEAVNNWTEDMEGYYQNFNQELPTNIPWKVFANILLAAKMYE